MRIAPLLLLAALPCAAACGSDSTPPTGPSSGTVSLTSVQYLTGEVTLNQYGIIQFFGNADILVGDQGAFQPNYAMRGITTFNMRIIPRSATINNAVLQLAQCQVTGAPYSSLGTIVVDHVPAITNSQDTALFDTTAVAAAVATLSTDASLGLKSATVTSSVAADRAAGDTLMQFRLRFSAGDTNGDSVSDFAVFSADSNLTSICAPFVSGHQPLLIVTYQ